MSEVNKVIFAGAVLLDLTSDTIIEDVIVDGYTGHDSAGNRITGKLKIITVDEALDTESENPVQNKVITNALAGYVKASEAIVGLSVEGNVITCTRGDGTTFDVPIPVATQTSAGVMSAEDKKSLDNFWADEP